MDQRLTIPKFESESEEARWWFENQDALFEEFEQAGRNGELGRGTVARRAKEAEMMLALGFDADDVARAEAQARRHGMEYQAYIRMVVRRALLLEEQSA